MDKKTKKKMGRPRIEIDWKTIDKLCAIQCTDVEISGFMGYSRDTLQRATKRVHKKTFAKYIAEKSQGGKISLRRQVWKRVEEGSDTMIIWATKNYLKMQDKPTEVKNDDEIKINITVNEKVK